MKCKECGALIPDISRFCLNCGVPIKKDTDNSDESKENTSKDATENNEEGQDNAEDSKEVISQNEADNIAESKSESETSQSKEKSEKSEETEPAGNAEPENDTAGDTPDDTEDDKKDDTTADNAADTTGGTPDDTEDDVEDEDNSSKGYAIMVNPDYVPPEIEEEKPLFEEHFDYQSVYREKMEKFEAMLTRVGYVVGGLILVAVVGYFGMRFYYAHQYNTFVSDGDSAYESGNYTEAVTSYNQALNVKGADKKELADKIVKAYEAEGRYDLAYNDLIAIYNDVADENGGDSDMYSEVLRLKGLVEGDDKEDSKAEGDKDASVTTESDSTQPTKQDNTQDTDPASESTADPAGTPAPGQSSEQSTKPDSTQAAATGEKKVDVTDRNVHKLAQSLIGAFENMMSTSIDDGVVKRLVTSNFSDVFTGTGTTYYTRIKRFVEEVDDGTAMVVYGADYVYYGEFKDGKRQGKGILISASKNDEEVVSYYVYRGDWANDLPNGKGSVKIVNNFGEENASITVIAGSFVDGYENGEMTKSVFEGGNSKEKKNYTADGKTAVKGLGLQ